MSTHLENDFKPTIRVKKMYIVWEAKVSTILHSFKKAQVSTYLTNHIKPTLKVHETAYLIKSKKSQVFTYLDNDKNPTIRVKEVIYLKESISVHKTIKFLEGTSVHTSYILYQPYYKGP